MRNFWMVAVVLLVVGLILGYGLGASVSSVQNRSTVTQQVTSTLTISNIETGNILQYCFSPGGNCANLLVEWFGRANSSIHILIYSFTLNNVGDALVAAKQRNVDVEVVYDQSNWNASGSEYQKLVGAGIQVRVDHRPGLLHDKVAILDSRIVITGSFNWSNQANETNRENLIVIDDSSVAAAYEQQFQSTWNAST